MSDAAHKTSNGAMSIYFPVVCVLFDESESGYIILDTSWMESMTSAMIVMRNANTLARYVAFFPKTHLT